ncbi:hypothetical protein ACQUSY_01560 [Microbacterium sp. YY-03]|uniref:hypothetical protein n=1 Tax=Microbacterium sp. YY-03 TaxID=3421636 RepID=UPI003D16AF5F
MTTNDGSPHPPSFMLAALGAVVFVSLIITGDAITSVMTATNVIEVPNASPLIPIVAIGAATVVWGLIVIRGIRRRGSFGTATIAGLLASLAYLAGLFFSSLGSGIAAAAVVTHNMVNGYTLVVLIAGVVTAAATLALSRASGETPQWPWEQHSDDDE